MRNFKKTAAQGEVNIKLIEKLPVGLSLFDADGEFYIIGHSESGNHHVLERECVDVFVGEKTTAGMQVLYAIVKEPTKVRQLRDGSPHETIDLDAGDILRITPSIDYNPYAKMIERARD